MTKLNRDDYELILNSLVIEQAIAHVESIDALDEIENTINKYVSIEHQVILTESNYSIANVNKVSDIIYKYVNDNEFCKLYNEQRKKDILYNAIKSIKSFETLLKITNLILDEFKTDDEINQLNANCDDYKALITIYNIIMHDSLNF